MNELATYILDIAQNSLNAFCQHLEICIDENLCQNTLTITIIDDGKGIKDIKKVESPFYTTNPSKRFGFGISLFMEIVNQCNGKVEITSSNNQTKIQGTMEYFHLNRLVLGNISEVISMLFWNSKDVDLIYKHHYNNKKFILNKDIIVNLFNNQLSQYEMNLIITKYIEQQLKKIRR